MMAVFALGIVAGAAASFVGFVLWFRGRAPPDYRAPALDVTGGRRGGHPETVAAFQPAYRAEATRADDESARVTQTDSAANVAGVGEPRQVLLEEIERLESRIGKLEESRDSASRATPYHMPPRPANPVLSRPLPAPVAPEPHVGRLSLGRAKRVTLLLANTETLLKAGRPKEALASAEEVLALEPTSIDAVVKRGKALEDLGRPEEAITAYDRAIQIDAGSTIAYLRKGELFNKLERYNEALECYEKALGTQQQNGGR
jgi:tetratricopeptide (TPR) repeat protein